MKCNSITFSNFRNVEDESCSFSDGVNVLWGKNAQGKSNILEGIYFFARGRSFRGATEKEMIRFKSSSATLSLEFIKDGDRYPVSLAAISRRTDERSFTETERVSRDQRK